MSEANATQTGENTREQVAFNLMQLIASCENRSFNAGIGNTVDREWVLGTYSQCLAIVNRSPVASVMKMYQP